MNRQIRVLPAIVLMFVTLVVGLIGGAALGGAAGYWYGTQGSDSATPTATTTTSDATQPDQSAVATGAPDEVVSRVNPAVVTVVNHLEGAGPGGQSGEATGTGMIIDTEGHIVTNYHVIDSADSLEVIFSDGQTVPATLVGGDRYQDVAVIKVDPPVPATVTFGDSSKVQPGQRVIAIGSALGEFHNTVTDGIVSATGRSLDTGEGWRLEHLIQHDAPINPGNSGGPLIDVNGNVIGMNTAVVRGGFGQPGAEGLGFAIDSNTVKSYAEQLIANGRIDHPFLGIGFRTVAGPDVGRDSSAQPVLVVEVAAGSPAEKAGLEVGDIITAIDGMELDDQHPFINTMYEHKAGDTVTLTVRRDGSTHDVTVTLGNQPEQ